MFPSVIAPSLLSANWACFGQEAKKVLEAGADWLHIDVMDNHYVPNLTFGPKLCEALRQYGIQAHLDVHLMVEPVDDLIVRFAKSGANSISFHPEASKHVDRSLSIIKDQGCQAGLVLNPATPLQALEYVLEKLDLVLFMTVNPGFSGQSFIPAVLQKIQAMQVLLNEVSHSVRIAVDGGITIKNIQRIAGVGANTFISGDTIFKSEDYAATISAMRKALGGGN